MTSKQILFAVLIVALLAVVVGAVVFVRQGEMPFGVDEFSAPDTVRDGNEPNNTEPGNIREPLVVTHEYMGTAHEYGGSITLPTPCHELQAEALVAESFPEQITIALETVAPAPETVCTQVLDRKTFDLTVRASAEAVLTRVMLDGVSIPFDVFEEAKG